MVNMRLVGDRVVNGTNVVTSNQTSPDSTCLMLPDDETRFSMLANLFTSNGYRGEVYTYSLNYRICGSDNINARFEILVPGAYWATENILVGPPLTIDLLHQYHIMALLTNVKKKKKHF